MAKTKFNWKKSARKAGIVGGEILVLGVIGYFASIPELVYLIPMLEGLRNAIKHWK